MHPRSRCALVVLATVLSACQTARAPSSAASESGKREAAPADFLVRRSTFTGCELEAFISLTAARSALMFHATKDSLLAARSTGPWQRAMIADLFAQIEGGGLKNHPYFAAEKFYQCAEREELAVRKNVGGAAVCLARLDIVFYLDSDRRKGRTREEALARFRRSFANVPESVFPAALVEQLAPMAFRISADDDEYELRRLVFETCLFPGEWKAWREGDGRKEG